MQRRFTAAGRDQIWLTDLTEHHIGEGKLYLCAIKTCTPTGSVGYCIDERMKARLAVTALTNEMAMRRPAGTVLHSNRVSSGPKSSSKRCGITV